MRQPLPNPRSQRSFTSFSLFLFFLCLYVTGFAQTANFTYFGIENGLPQSGIQTMVQDKRGNIWFGTLAGVSRYDGLAFRNYTREKGLAENWITASCIDRQGNIWFGHWAGGVSFYNYAKDTITVVSMKGIALYKAINVIYEDQEGTIWFGTEGSGIMKYTPPPPGKDPLSGSFSLLDKNSGISGNNIYAIIQDRKGILWFGTENGITTLNPKESILKDAVRHVSVSDGLPDNEITALLEYTDGSVWMGTRNAGVARYMPAEKSGGGAPEVIIYNTSSGLTHNHVRVLYQDDDLNIWVGTYGGGISKYNPLMDRKDLAGKTSLFRRLSTMEGLSNNKVLSILKDREGNIWIGTYIGLNQYRDEHFEIYGRQEGLTSSLIWSILQDRDGHFWFGTEGGLFRYNPVETDKAKIITGYTTEKGLPNNNINSVFEDANGNIWGSSWGSGVFKLDRNSQKIEKLTSANGLPTNDIYCINSDKDGNLWLGCDKGGASMYNPVTRQFRNFTDREGLGSNRVFTIFRDSKDLLWFGTLGGGLSVFNGETFKNFSEADGLRHKFVLCITEDKDGNIWIGTYGGGLYKYDGKTFTNYPIKNGLNMDTPYLITCDNENNIWIGTSLGLDKFNQTDKTFLHYGQQEGFLGIETNPNAVCRDVNGNLWFGTIIGAVKYNTKKSKKNDVEPITYLRNIEVFFKNFGLPQNHVFKHIENNITFNFIGVSLTSPKKVKYQYMMVGVDKDWSPPGYTNHVTYPNLAPGSYTFLVKASNNDGKWNQKPVEYTFSITPPFYMTTWFYCLSALAFVSGLYLFVKIRTRNLNEAKRRLEEQVSLKTQELRAEKEKVERTNLELEKLSIVARETHNGVIITDPNGNIEWINEGYTRMVGYTPEEFLQMKGKALSSVSANKNISNIIRESIEKRTSVIYESINYTKDLKEFWASSTLTPIFDETGKVKKLIIIESDITERKKNEEIIKEKNTLLEQKNKDITDSINYAKRIQEAILPQRELVRKFMPQSFVFYKPKDIVSGDFYWLGHVNGQVIAAAVDCTGHGVPGAFMSIIGYTLLNEIINERKITQPSEILNQLHREVSHALHQHTEDAETKDGMDIAICTIDPKKQEVQFAGAMRPLYVVSGFELKEIKGDKFPIGGHYTEKAKRFTNHTLRLKSNDSVYLFSDGYLDQFGGPEGKKFMSKNFKELLLELQDFEMTSQEVKLKETLETWQGKMEQVDDVMVLGLKLS